jgi:hypothetical protein
MPEVGTAHRAVALLTESGHATAVPGRGTRICAGAGRWGISDPFSSRGQRAREPDNGRAAHGPALYGLTSSGGLGWHLWACPFTGGSDLRRWSAIRCTGITEPLVIEGYRPVPREWTPMGRPLCAGSRAWERERSHPPAGRRSSQQHRTEPTLRARSCPCLHAQAGHGPRSSGRGSGFWVDPVRYGPWLGHGSRGMVSSGLTSPG